MPGEIGKKIIILYILQILRRYTDADHTMTQQQIIDRLRADYGLEVNRSTVRRNLEDLIDAGIDVFQFDQPDAYPTEVLAKEFASRAVFYSPVDIQKVLPTGDRELIEKRAAEMCELFRAAGGGWIAKDYGSYGDIGVDPEWAGWAQAVIEKNSSLE